MSTLRECAQITQSLTPEDYSVLSTLARLLTKFRNVPKDVVIRESGLHAKNVEFSLSKLHEYKLISRTTYGYRLLYAGLDVLALHALRSEGVVFGLGTPIALGKESDVYEAVGRDNELLAVKAFRIGRISFRDIKRKRGYVGGELHEWLFASIRAAGREYGVLRRLARRGLQVPSPRARSYHLVVMDRVEGVLLRYVRRLRNPSTLLKEILDHVRACYLDAGVVNGDLSEFNVLVSLEGDEWKRVYIIDWPQAVGKDRPGAEDLLRRDVENVVRFFKKRFKTSIDVNRAIGYVKGLSDSLEC